MPKYDYEVLYEPVVGGLMAVVLPDKSLGLTVRGDTNFVPVEDDMLARETIKSVYNHFSEQVNREKILMPSGWEEVKVNPVESYESLEGKVGVMEKLEQLFPKMKDTPGVIMKSHDNRRQLKEEKEKFSENSVALTNVSDQLRMTRSLENVVRNSNEEDEKEKRSLALSNLSELKKLKEANQMLPEKDVSVKYIKDLMLHNCSGNKQRDFHSFKKAAEMDKHFKTCPYDFIKAYKKSCNEHLEDPFDRMTRNLDF